jgi:hypothetical protein
MSDSQAIAAETKSAKERIAKLAALTDPKPAKASILSAMSGKPSAEVQKTTITRAALEGLCEKAGITMDWNYGNPIFKDSGVRQDIADLEKRYAQAERAVLEEKVKELQRIADQQRQGVLSTQAANSMAKAAAQQMDTMANDVIKEKVEAQMRADAIANEARIRADMKAKGATDADIDAAVTLLGWKPDQSLPEPPKFLMGVDLARDPEDWTADDMAAYFAKLDAGLMSVSGLNDLLSGSAPAQVTSGDALTAQQVQTMVAALKANNTIYPGAGAGIAIVHPSTVFQSEISDLINRKMQETLRAPLPHLMPDQHIGWKARIKGVLDA